MQDTSTMLRSAGDAVLRWSPAQRLHRHKAARQLAVLAYHDIDDGPNFDRQLAHLRRVATPVSLDEVLAAFRGAPLPDRPALVTFDDGDPTVARDALPLLQEHRVPAVAFVTPGVLDTHTPHWWTEVEMLYAAGARHPGRPGESATTLVRWLKTVPDTERLDVLARLRGSVSVQTSRPQLSSEDLRTLVAGDVAVGNHTWSHPCLDQCTEDVAVDQVRRAHDALAGILDAPPRAFAYPNGNVDPRVDPVLRELGYEAAFLFDHRLAPTPRAGADPWRISRLRVSSGSSLDRFAAILSGLHPALHHLRGRV